MPAPSPPEIVDAALLAVAQGHTNASAGRLAGVTRQAVANWRERWADRAERIRDLAGYRWARNVLRRVDRITDAQATAAEDATCRHGPQAARVLLEGAKMIGGPRDVTINGDVSVDASVTVDARKVAILATDASARAARLAELRAKFGVE